MQQDRRSQSTPNVFYSPNIHQVNFESMSSNERRSSSSAVYTSIPSRSPNQPMFSMTPIVNSPTNQYSSHHDSSHSWTPTSNQRFSFTPNTVPSPTGHAWQQQQQRDDIVRSSPMMMPSNSPAHHSPTRERQPHRYFPYPPVIQAPGMTSPHQELPSPHEYPTHPNSYHHPSNMPYHDSTNPSRAYRPNDSHLGDPQEERRD